MCEEAFVSLRLVSVHVTTMKGDSEFVSMLKRRHLHLSCSSGNWMER